MIPVNDLVVRLEQTDPVEPRGWFRWLHYHFLGRYDYYDGRLEEELQALGLDDEFGEQVSGLVVEERAALIAGIARHAWSVGRLGLVRLADSVWESLDYRDRGALLAGLSELIGVASDAIVHDRLGMVFDEGLSEAGGDSLRLEWMRVHLPECAFSSESACELGCNAIRRKWPDVLAAVTNSGAELSATVRRGDERIYPRSDWPEVEMLSHRVIDMILEAAFVRRDEDAAILALQRGANPDIPIWRLERSFNERHCALSFAISEGLFRVVDLLMQLGASPQGIEFSTINQPLYSAVEAGRDDLADLLLQRGATLSTKRNPSERQRFFGLFKEELDWARHSVGAIVELVPISEKQGFYNGNGQGGQWRTILNLVIKDVQRLRHYESKGLDTRLTAEELCSAIHSNAHDGLAYLLRNDPNRDRVMALIRQRWPNFGTGR